MDLCWNSRQNPTSRWMALSKIWTTPSPWWSRTEGTYPIYTFEFVNPMHWRICYIFSRPTGISIHFRRITSFHHINYGQIALRSSIFWVSILYFQDTEASAVVEWIRGTTQWTGTQIMHIVHHILPRLGVGDASVQNKARFAYEYRGCGGNTLKTHISLIELRCIRGRTTDWYAEFGYFNGRTSCIALRMQAIYNNPVQDKKGNLRINATLGPYLLDLWMRSDKTEFHKAYLRVLGEFECLVALRDDGKWTRTFIRNEHRFNCPVFEMKKRSAF